MAWETALDRLILQQIHLAERGETRAKDVEQQIVALRELAPERPETAFHCGYARTLLGLDLPSPGGDPALGRWYLFGRVRGHDRRGERNWVADLLHEGGMLLDLLQDARIAAQCLPLVMRTLFWSQDLSLAVHAIEFLAAGDRGDDRDMLVDAALTDLLGRLEVREDREDVESTAAILERCLDVPGFGRLPRDVQARYHRALGLRRLSASEFEAALDQFERAHELASGAARLRSNVEASAALAAMRLHGLEELEPQPDRTGREDAHAWVGRTDLDTGDGVPEAMFVSGILAYETGDFLCARARFDRCLAGLRRTTGRDVPLIHRTRFFLAAAILASGQKEDSARALRLMDLALEQVHPDLESFYRVHEALKALDRRLALKFLDAVDLGRGTAPDQLLFVALEYLSLAEAEPASAAARRVLQVAVNLDQRIEAMRVLLTARNMQGDRAGARQVFLEVRDLLMQRGAFQELESLLVDEEAVGQALDHLEVKCELVSLYEEMEDREFEKASLQTAIARSLRARKDVESLQEAFGLLKEVEIAFPDLAREDLQALEKMLALADSEPTDPDSGPGLAQAAAAALGHEPRVLVVGGNERQRRHHPRLEQLGKDWGLRAEWLMANYTSPQRVVSAIEERLEAGLDVLLLLHWNRHETTEPALEAARRRGVQARTVHYAGFTSLQVALMDVLGKLGNDDGGEPVEAAKPARGGKRKR